MTFRWLRFRRRKERRSEREDHREKHAEASEADTDLLERIAAGIALNKFPPR